MPKKQQTTADEKLLAHIRTLSDAQIIEDMYVSYTDAIDFIIHKGLRIDYGRWVEDRNLYIEIERRIRVSEKPQSKKWEN